MRMAGRSSCQRASQYMSRHARTLPSFAVSAVKIWRVLAKLSVVLEEMIDASKDAFVGSKPSHTSVGVINLSSILAIISQKHDDVKK